jgi:type I restriction enzyme S subunit
MLNNDGVYVDKSLVSDYILQDGDILFSRSGTVGRSFVYNSHQHNECAYAGYLVRFVPNSLLLPTLIAS